MVTLPKISLGKKNKRSYFNLTHDVNTTSDFGFCQPTLVREFYKDCKISLKTKEFVRLGAMPCPTFGRIEVKTHTAFVPVKETFLAYDYFQAQKTVQSANRSYIPQSADYVRSHTLLKSLVDLVVDVDNYWHTGLPFPTLDLQRSFGRLSINCFWHDFCPSTHALYSQHQPYDIVDVMNDPVICTNQELVDNAYKFIVQFITSNPATDAISSDSPFYTFLNSVFASSDLGKINTLTGSILANYVRPVPVMFMSYVAGRLQPSQTLYLQGFASYFTALGVTGSTMTSYIQDYRAPMDPANADFLLGDTTFGYTDKWNTQKTDVKVWVNLHLTRTGRRWYKIMTGCRISFGTKSKKIDLMRLFSYYKAWFDKYNPGRNLQWLDTNCFGLIHSFYDYGYTLDDILRYQRPASSDIPDVVQVRYRKWWYNFLVDLPACCYVLKPDNMTCATATPLLEIDNNDDSINTIGLYNDNADPGVGMQTAGMGADAIFGRIDDVSLAGGLGIQLLNRIYHLVNKNSVIGSKIDEYLKAHNISRGLPQSNVLGDDSFMCNIDDVFATAGTSESALGEYAGKGIGSGSSDNMHFECESFGYLIQLVSVVPLGGYVQGMRDCPINRYDFYQPEFDSLGMEPMSKSNFINRRYDLSTFDSDDVVFGFRPRYFGLKIENNLANGGFSLRSQQAQFLPYSLDRLFDIKGNFGSEGLITSEDYVADEELRYIGRYEKFGNYDRIFYDTSGYTDNFIVHMIQELSMYAPWKSISDSYDTFDKDVDDTSIDVEKA